MVAGGASFRVVVNGTGPSYSAALKYFGRTLVTFPMHWVSSFGSAMYAMVGDLWSDSQKLPFFGVNSLPCLMRTYRVARQAS